MNCSVCRTPLPQGVAYCPTCGTPTSSSYSAAGTTPDAATVVSTPPPPPTNYGPQPYGTASPYNTPSVPYDPYNVAPPSPSPQRRSNRMGLIIGAVLLVLILILGGVVALLLRGTQVTVTPAQATATAQAQATAKITSAQTAVAQANASATAQVNAQATATATVFQNIYTQATGGTPALSDPLSSQDSNSWDISKFCSFNGGTYHAIDSMQNNFATCMASSSNFMNFAYQVQMVINKGDWGGLTFRSDNAENNFYYVEVHSDGSYSFKVYKNNSFFKTLISGTSSAFKTGLGQSNSIAVVAQGSNFYLYINGQYAVSANDTNFASGEIGVAGGDDTHPADVSFSNLKVWKV